ncbi:RICIN domain-containing protein [Kitasatospora sp. NBC_00240]|uniref:RICIN domain-containing protein n=1 Tax=Kitasatospora sp. NBC_00240 TaxID=2903567 RepID=UPI00224D5C42|nr:RICIN domain-containing protein [Kitasatospora sp. NBC_00240]MCX5208439.1 RICIN domain-containing protein [Kitasatospora sp. NBC_00240]
MSGATKQLADAARGARATSSPAMPWAGGTTQRWTLAGAGGGYVKIFCVRSGKLLAVQGDAVADLAAIVQQSDSGDPSQQWQRIAV